MKNESIFPEVNFYISISVKCMSIGNCMTFRIRYYYFLFLFLFLFFFYYKFDYYYYYYVLLYTHSKDIYKLATISNVFKVKLNNCLHLFDSRFCTKNAKYNFNLCKLIFYANSPLAMKSHFTKKVNSYKYLT